MFGFYFDFIVWCYFINGVGILFISTSVLYFLESCLNFDFNDVLFLKIA